MSKPTAKEFIEAFDRTGIKAVFNSFDARVENGMWAAPQGCGCAVTAFMLGKPSRSNDIVRDFYHETGIMPWSFVAGFDGQAGLLGYKDLDLPPEARIMSEEDRELGEQVRLMVLSGEYDL